jgi:hypothetical protein
MSSELVTLKNAVSYSSAIAKRMKEQLKNGKFLPQLWARTLRAKYFEYQLSRFKNQGAIDGLERWPDVKPKYRDWKVRMATGGSSLKTSKLSRSGETRTKTVVKEGGTMVMVLTGRLLKAVATTNASAGYAEIKTDNRIRVKTNVPWAWYRQTGGKRRKFNTYGKKFRSMFKSEVKKFIIARDAAK